MCTSEITLKKFLKLLLQIEFWGTFFTVLFNYVTRFCVLYIVASYLRLYPCRWMERKALTCVGCIGSLLISWLSVAVMAIWPADLSASYYFVADCNKILPLVTALFAFLFFKNLKLGTNKLINVIASVALERLAGQCRVLRNGFHGYTYGFECGGSLYSMYNY